MKFIEIKESTVSGAVASVAKPLGKLKERTQVDGMVPAEKVMKGKSKKKGPYANSISEGKMKDLAYAIKHLDDVDFSKAYGQTKDYFTKRLGNPPPEAKVSTAKPSPAQTPAAPSSKSGSKVWHDTGYTDKKAAQKIDEPIKEDELNEEDLIILPGMLRGKDKSFISKEHDRRDHEVEMARSDLYAAAKNAMRIFQLLKNRTEDEGLMGWQQSYITLAADYLNSVADSMEYDSIANEGIASSLGTWLAKRSLGDLPQTPEVRRAIANRAGQYSHAISDAGKIGAGAGAVYVGQAVGNKINQAREKDVPKGKIDIEVLNPSNSDSLNYVVPNSKYKIQPNLDYNTIPPQSKQPLKPAGHLNKPFKLTAEGAGVIAGGMSNFEEARFGGYYNPLDQERREQDAMDQERRDFKRREMEYELRGEEEAAKRANEGPWYIRIDGKLVRDKNKDPYVFNTLEAARKAAQTMMKKDWNKGKQFSMTRSMTENTTVTEGSKRMSAAVKLQRAFDREKASSDASRNRGKEELEKARKEYDKKQAEKNKQDVTEEKCNECGGVAYADESIAEEKDACYNKVKSRYKVWPSAYASGALSKCRKVGASNWGNKSKK